MRDRLCLIVAVGLVRVELEVLVRRLEEVPLVARAVLHENPPLASPADWEIEPVSMMPPDRDWVILGARFPVLIKCHLGGSREEPCIHRVLVKLVGLVLPRPLHQVVDPAPVILVRARIRARLSLFLVDMDMVYPAVVSVSMEV